MPQKAADPGTELVDNGEDEPLPLAADAAASEQMEEEPGGIWGGDLQSMLRFKGRSRGI